MIEPFHNCNIKATNIIVRLLSNKKNTFIS